MNTTSFFRDILHNIKHGLKPNPIRDWFVVVIVTIIFLALDIVLSFFGFQSVMSVKQPNVITPTVAPMINQKAIHEAQQLFDTRASEQTKYESGSYSFADPAR